MKKYLALLLALCMVFALCACGGEKEPAAGGGDDGETITLTYWAHEETPWNVSNEKLIAAFEEQNPGIKIEFESYPYDDFEQKVRTSLMSKSGGADIYELWGGWGYEYAPTGVFSEVPADLLGDLKEDCYAPVLGAFEVDGKYYGVPMEFNAEYGGMLVNKVWFDENNVAYPTTWDEMIKIATENSVSQDGIFDMRGFDFICFDTLPYTFLSMILSSGGQYLNGDTFDFNTPEAKAALTDLVKYVQENKTTNIEGLTGSDFENQHWLFLNQALMVPRGMWTIPAGETDYDVHYGTDFDYISTPFYGAEQKWAAETGWGLAVNAQSEYQEAAWKFISFVMDPDNLLQLDIDRGLIPPRKSVATDPAFVEAVPYAKPIVDVLDGASWIGPINTDVLKEGICNMFVDIIQNGVSIDDALVNLNAALVQ